MRTPSLWAIVILLVVVLLLFGARRLPDIVASVGKSLKIFKREVKDLTADVTGDGASREVPAPSAAPTDTSTTASTGSGRSRS